MGYLRILQLYVIITWILSPGYFSKEKAADPIQFDPERSMSMFCMAL